jgi:hypothetical protein
MIRFVYFLRCADGAGPIKIGSSINPQIRANAIGRQVGKKLIVEAKANGGWMAENELHRKLSGCRSDFSGREWFEPTPLVLGIVRVAKETGCYDKIRRFMHEYEASVCSTVG